MSSRTSSFVSPLGRLPMMSRDADYGLAALTIKAMVPSQCKGIPSMSIGWSLRWHMGAFLTESSSATPVTIDDVWQRLISSAALHQTTTKICGLKAEPLSLVDGYLQEPWSL